MVQRIYHLQLPFGTIDNEDVRIELNILKDLYGLLVFFELLLVYFSLYSSALSNLGACNPGFAVKTDAS
jgi:hypothetical protein